MPLLTQEQYWLKPGESIPEYNERIARLREETGIQEPKQGVEPVKVEPVKEEAAPNRKIREETGIEKDITETRNFLRETYPLEKPRSEEKIREDLQNAAQAQIDAITQEYQAMISKAREIGEESERRTRALNITGGLGGSPFATARARETEKKTEETVEALRKEKSLKVAEVLGRIDERAIEIAQKERQQAFERAESRLERLESYQSEQQEFAKKDIKTLAKSVDLETFKDEEPDTYAKLKRQSGFESDFLFDAYWQENVPEEEKTDWKVEEFMEGDDGKAIYRMEGLDKDGNWVSKKYETDIPNEQIVNKTGAKYSYKIDDKGRMVFVPDKIDPDEPLSEQILIYGETGEFGKDETGEGGEGKEEKPLSMWEISEFSRVYGWTPPYGFTESQLTQFMKDNPTATPEELERGAKQALTEVEGESKPSEEYLSEDWFRSEFSESELRKMSKEMGTSKFFRSTKKDIEAFLKSVMEKVNEDRAEGYSDDEIIKEITTKYLGRPYSEQIELRSPKENEEKSYPQIDNPFR